MKRHSFFILLIDVNVHGLVARKAGLEEHGYQVVTAKGGCEGLEKFERQRFDLVVTDHRMPDLGGCQVLARIRELSPTTPIVILSGFAQKLGLTEESTGADAVLMKGPSEMDDLVRTIARLVKHKPARARAATASAAPARARRSA